MSGDRNCASKPLTICRGEQGRAPRGQSRCRTYFRVAISSAARRIVNRSAESKEKSDTNKARENKRSAKPRVSRYTFMRINWNMRCIGFNKINLNKKIVILYNETRKDIIIFFFHYFLTAYDHNKLLSKIIRKYCGVAVVFFFS